MQYVTSFERAEIENLADRILEANLLEQVFERN
jgi:hypothetical protein